MARTKKEYVPDIGDRVKFTNTRGLTRIGTFLGFHVPELSNINGVWTYYEVSIDGTTLKGYSLSKIQPVKTKKS